MFTNVLVHTDHPSWASFYSFNGITGLCRCLLFGIFGLLFKKKHQYSAGVHGLLKLTVVLNIISEENIKEKHYCFM